MPTSSRPSSPLTPAAARRILDYDRAVFARFERKIRRLPKEGAFRDRGTGHATFFGTLVHILNVRDAWFNFVVLAEAEEAEEERFFGRPLRKPADWKLYRQYAQVVWDGHEAVRRGLTQAALDRPVSAFWMKGRYSLGDAILQVSYEQAYHLGEIIGALWVVDSPPPEMTWISVNRVDLGYPDRRGPAAPGQ